MYRERFPWKVRLQPTWLTRKLPYPADLSRRLAATLPGDSHGQPRPSVRVTPRTADGRKSAVWATDFYEVNAFYVSSDPASLGPLEDALRALPCVCRTARVLPGREVDRDWPVGSTRRDRMLRVQVLALMRDPLDQDQRVP
jgi:hypothetical protein